MGKYVIGNGIDDVYLHFLRENFKAALDQDSNLRPNIDKKNIAAVYDQHVTAAKARYGAFISDLKKIMSEEAANKMAESLSKNNIMDIIEKTLNIKSGSLADLAASVKELLMSQKAGTPNNIWDFQKRINEALDNGETGKALIELQNLIDHFNSINGEIGNINQVILDYCNNNRDSMTSQLLKGTFMKSSNTIQIFDVNQAQFTSYKKLIERLKLLQKVVNSGQVTKNTTIQYINSKDKLEDVAITEAVNRFNGLIVQILGGVGESYTAMYAAVAVGKLFEEFSEELNKYPGLHAKVEGVGTQTKINGQITKRDVEVVFSNGNISVSAGITAKAKSPNKKTGKTSKTLFAKEDLSWFLADVQNKYKYNFLNNIALQRTGLSEAMVINRYIAAVNFDKSVAGDIKKALFLSYLDRIITIQDFYDDIATLVRGDDSNLKRAPMINVIRAPKAKDVAWKMNPKSTSPYRHGMSKETTRGDVGWIDETPTEKTVHYAWTRSKELLKLLYEAKARLTF